MTERDADERRIRGVLALAGVLGSRCLGLSGLVGGAAVTGETAAGVTAVSGTVTTLSGLLAVGLATALPLIVIGFVLTRRTRKQ